MTISLIEINLMPLLLLSYTVNMGVFYFYLEHHVEQNYVLQKFQQVYV